VLVAATILFDIDVLTGVVVALIFTGILYLARRLMSIAERLAELLLSLDVQVPDAGQLVGAVAGVHEEALDIEVVVPVGHSQSDVVLRCIREGVAREAVDVEVGYLLRRRRQAKAQE
jgi:hypothetical protein